VIASADKVLSGNLYSELPSELLEEEFTTLLSAPNVRIERIVSRGHASPPEFWYDQSEAEWVILLAGSAGLLIEGEDAPRRLGPGDYLHLPAHTRHRLAFTDPQRPTVWLAVYYGTKVD
jgi:cupin 2 domain-containing protein